MDAFWYDPDGGSEAGAARIGRTGRSMDRGLSSGGDQTGAVVQLEHLDQHEARAAMAGTR